ncbi:MAG: hypothetical protein K6T77_07740 [candidate division WOR-3 bacterium]|nr:hypothetical protein [candidate division WOR-3 bacterium]MCR4423917.1 hypothetical protein [candidate division WOR-3 bacterium]MDH7519255.1 hypothetical protein [bacterium]
MKKVRQSEAYEDIFAIKLCEVQHLAKKRFGRYLDETEIKDVQKRIQFGLECWEEVVLYAIEDVMRKNSANDKDSPKSDITG